MILAKPNARRGLTLIELLAVVAIMVILIGVSIPLLSPLLENRKIREGSRELNAYFVGAQARAAELQRPVGVWIEPRANAGPGAGEAFDLFMAEAPPPYAGDTIDARCGVVSTGARTGEANFDNNSLLAFSPPPGSLPPGQSYFVQQGDLIRFDYRSVYYEITGVDRNNGKIYFQTPFGYPNVLIPNVMLTAGTPSGLPYQIFRREIRSTVGALTLPDTVSIDLTVSGVGLGGSEFAPAVNSPPGPVPGPIIIMFHPRGGVDYVRASGSVGPPIGPIHLLIGQAEKVVLRTNDGTDGNVNDNTYEPILPDANLADPANLWLTINHRTGAVTTSENGVYQINTSLPTPDVILADAIGQARAIAKSGDSMGGT